MEINIGSTFWCNFQTFLNKNIPSCLIKLLVDSGYDNAFSVENLDLEHLIDMEKYIQDNMMDTIHGFNCCYSTNYQQQKLFRFLPAHRSLILGLKEKVKDFISSEMQPSIESASEIAKYSKIFGELIATAQKNIRVPPHGHRYSDVIKYFSIYVYMVSGRACYDMLSNNLPLPKSSTISKYIFIWNFY